VDSSPARGDVGRHGEALAQITTEIVHLYRDYYGRGPTRAKSYMLGEGFVVTVVRDSMTTVERTLTEAGHGGQVRLMRMTFQAAMSEPFKEVVARALSRSVVAYHGQLLVDADIGFEMFVLD
jgi:uncharacterized protein YbcI